MKNKTEFELYTRPTCSDCQAAKEYLASHQIDYEHKDVDGNPGLEEELKKVSGTRSVPSFAFYKKRVLWKEETYKELYWF